HILLDRAVILADEYRADQRVALAADGETVEVGRIGLERDERERFHLGLVLPADEVRPKVLEAVDEAAVDFGDLHQLEELDAALAVLLHEVSGQRAPGWRRVNLGRRRAADAFSGPGARQPAELGDRRGWRYVTFGRGASLGRECGHRGEEEREQRNDPAHRQPFSKVAKARA